MRVCCPLYAPIRFLEGCTGKVFVFFILFAIRGGVIRCGWIFVCMLEVSVIVLNKVPMRVYGRL